MGFRNPLTSLPFSAITGQIDPATQVAPGVFPGGVIAESVKTALAGRRMELTATNADRITFYTGDSHEQFPGLLQINSSGASPKGSLTLYAPTMFSGGEPITQLGMTSRSADGTQRSTMSLLSDYLLLRPTDLSGNTYLDLVKDALTLAAGAGSVNLVGADAKLNGFSLARPADVSTGWKLLAGSFTVTFAAGVASAAVPFSTAFGGTPIVVAVCAPITGNTSVTLNVSSANSSQFAYRAQQQATGTAYNGTVQGYYIAIGP